MITFPLKFILVLLGTFFIGVILTPLVRLLAFKIGAVAVSYTHLTLPTTPYV